MCFILLACCIAVAIWDGGGSNLKTDGPIICLERKATLGQPFDLDTICTTLAAGDSVRVLGVDRSSFGQKWLVETHKGDIGWIDASDLSGISQIVTDDADKGDTVSVKAKWLGSFIHRYIYSNSKGEEKERSTDGFIPVFDGWEDYEYNRDGYAGVCSVEKFEKAVIGKSLDEVNDRFGSPVLQRITPNGIEAQYSWKIFEPSTGRMLRPDVSFSPESVASAVSFVAPTSRAAFWLRHMPLASTIIDWPVTSLMIRGSRYNIYVDAMPSTGIRY